MARHDLPANLHAIMDAKGIPRRGRGALLAKMLDVTQPAAHKWLQGDSVPDLEKLLALAQWAGLTVDDLLRPKIANRLEEPTARYGRQLSDDEQRLIDAYRACSDEARTMIQAAAQAGLQHAADSEPAGASPATTRDLPPGGFLKITKVTKSTG